MVGCAAKAKVQCGRGRGLLGQNRGDRVSKRILNFFGQREVFKRKTDKPDAKSFANKAEGLPQVIQ